MRRPPDTNPRVQPSPVGRGDFDLGVELNPFLRYRDRLDSHRRALEGGLGDRWFVERVRSLDAAVAEIDGHGFRVTPILDGAALALAAHLDVDLVIKVEAGNVGGSHKARHLFGVALHLAVDEALGAPAADHLAIASCGNAALGAAVIAAAMRRRLDVYVPVWANERVVESAG